MPGKRTNGEGSVYYDSKREEYVGCIRCGKKPDGKPNKVVFRSGKGGKKSDVIKKMAEWRLRHEHDYAVTHKVRLEDGMKAWLETTKKPELKPSSYDRLESTINCQIIPRIGWKYVSELTDSIIMNEVIKPIMEEDGLSVSTAKKAYNALNEYFKYAVFTRAIPFNPMQMMKAPKASKEIDAKAAVDEDICDGASKVYLSSEKWATRPAKNGPIGARKKRAVRKPVLFS